MSAVPQGRVRRGSRTARTLGPALLRPGSVDADRLVASLGELKGAAMKVGQLLAVAQLGVLDEARRDKLRALFDAAPPVPWREIEPVLVREWGGPVARAVADIDPVPVAAASLGQVHRAQLPDGREAAVKVQYPGVADAVATDLRATGPLLRLARLIAPASDPRAVAAGLREAIEAELDYEREAAWQQRFFTTYFGHPWLHVPAVDRARSTRRVLVSEWVDGERHEAIRARGRKTRSRFGELVVRVALGGPARSGIFNADPHPGNWILRPDGRVSVLDFGCCAALPVAADPLPRVWRPAPGRAAVDVAEARRVAGAMRARGTGAADVLLTRLEIGVVSLLADLGARRDWSAILDEYRAGGPPGSKLGVDDRTFWFGRGRGQAAGPSQPPVSPL